MRFAVVAHQSSETNERLAAAATELGFDATVLPPREALRRLEPGDLALGRLDVRQKLDGIESGTAELERLAADGVDLLNSPGALVAAHDKLLTARALRLAGLPHPHTWLIAEGMPSPAPELPLVLKPRFGSWGRDVVLCRTQEELDGELERFALRSWFREHGALAQELIQPLGWDLRLVVAGGRVIGAARRIAADGEWRTNVSLGGVSEPVSPPPLARSLAIAAAFAVRADLVGVDLLPSRTGYVVSEINGAVDFRPWYALDGDDVYANAVLQLVRVVSERRVLTAV
ncbi:MAG TPA: ATP-grasp domain-containing protein [Gaiellaceae bacterium]|nr:ATP-grasp domain-containing protein [Gaiellaceae bacterium]